MGIETTMASTIIVAAAFVAKEAGKKLVGDAYDRLKARILAKGDVPALKAIEGPGDKAHYQPVLEKELDRPEITGDAGILELTEVVREGILAHEADLPPAYAMQVDSLRGAKGVILKQIEGIRAGEIVSEDGFVRITDVTAPKR